MHSSPTGAPTHLRPSAASHSPLIRPSPPLHPSPGHHPRPHHAHYASIAHLPTIPSPSSATTTLHPHPHHAPHHHAHALSLSTLPSYLSPTFNPAHLKPSPAHAKSPHPPLDPAQKDYFATAVTPAHATQPLRPWRLTSRVRTTAVALCLCLNAGTDPPDAERSQSSQQLSYTHILSSPSTATASVLQRLQAQYERWQPKAVYRHIGDPTPSQLEKQLRALRRSAGPNDRLLVHYNGYGVPRVTQAGELWLFNREYTQYLPVGVRDVLGWSGWPAVVVVEAASGGAVVEEVGRWVEEGKRADEERREAEARCKASGGGGGGVGKEKGEEEHKEREPGDEHTPRAFSILSSISSSPSPPPTSASPDPSAPPPLYPSATDLIVLSAPSAGQSPPLHPSLPADLFTCCLTTPLTIALRHFSLHSPLLPPLTPHQLDAIPGTLTDRRTPLGELNWIFTSITDTIAFSCLPPPLFHALFRQDLLVSSLFRNFLLAQRLLRQYGVVVCSWPAVPSCHKHALWEAWDSVVEGVCLQLDRHLHHAAKFAAQPFFNEQLAAFELTLDLLAATSAAPPLQLPIVLQLLLSPSHRRRALLLLARFLSRSAGAVQQVLDVGIFPYVLKLLEGGGGEVREVLCFVWVKLVGADSSALDELLSGGGWRYFLDGVMAAGVAVSERQRSMCLYLLAQLLQHKAEAQAAVSSPLLVAALLGYLDSDSAALRKWALLLLAKLLHGQPVPPLSASTSSPSAAQQSPAPTLADRVTMLCFDTQPDVRAAAVYALSCLLDDSSNSGGGGGGGGGLPASTSFSSTTSASLSHSLSPPPSPLDDVGADGGGAAAVAGASTHMLSIFRLLSSQLAYDGSGSVREELVVALSVLIDGQLDEFREAAREDEKEKDDRSERRREASEQHNPLPPLPPLTPTATQRSPSPLVSPVHGPRKLGLQQQSLAAVGRGTSGSPHSSSPSPSPPPTVFTGFAGSSLTLPLSRAFSEPPQSIAAARPSPPPSLVLSPSGSSSASISSLVDSSRPPSPATTAFSTLTASSSSSSLYAHDRAYLTPPRSLRLPLTSSLSSSPLQQRQHIWRCIRLLCQDAVPAVATAAVSIYRRVKEGGTAKASKHNKPSPVLNPHAQPDGLLVMPSAAAANDSSPRSLRQADSSPRGDVEGEAAGAAAEKRGAVALNPLRRIASAASNMAHAASDKTQSLFASASFASLHDGDRLLHPSSSSQSSPVHSASSSPQTLPAFAPVASSLSMLSLLSAPVASSVFARSADSFLAPSVDLSSVASSGGAAADSASNTLLSLMQREYRHRQNEQMYRAEAALACSSAAASAPLEQLYTLPSPAASSSASPTASSDALTCLLFHPYQQLLFAATAGRVSVFDLQRRERRCVWSNDNRAATRVTAAQLVNPHSVSLLATATDGGEVRVWRWPHERQPQLVNAWQGLRTNQAASGVGGRGRSGGSGGGGGSGGVGVAMEWMQAQGWMCCGGASDVVSVWDVEREACLIDLPIDDAAGGGAMGGLSGLPYYASVTCLTSSASSPLLFSGGLDGTLRCFDLRVPASSSCVTLSKQQSPLLRVQCTRAHDVVEEGNVVCASRDGEVLRVDMRYIVQRDERERGGSLHPPGSSSVGPVAQPGAGGGGMTSLTLSPAHAPLTAASSRNGSPSPSAASTAGSMSSSLSLLHPSPMLFPSHGSPVSTASSPAMLPHSAHSHGGSPALLAAASPFTHLTAFPAASPAAPAQPLSAFAVHPALSLYAAVSTSRALRVFSDQATLMQSSAAPQAKGGRPTQSSPQRRTTGRAGKDGRGTGSAAGGGGDGAGAAESVVAWHPCVLTMAAWSGGGDIAVYGQAGSGGSSAGGSSAASGGGGGKGGDGSSGSFNRSSHGLFSSSFIS